VSFVGLSHPLWAAPPGQARPGREMTTERGGILPYAGDRIPAPAKRPPSWDDLPVQRLLGAACLVVAVAVLSGVGQSAASTAATCRLTTPNGRVPPGAPESFFGNGRLATSPYGVIEVSPRTLNVDGSVSEKFPWWGSRSLRGPLRITGRRLHFATPRLRARVNEGYVSADTRFWASAITFPRPGCWRITGRVGRAQLSLVVRVPTSAAPTG
jgi:hypothetical protein